jgi:hypothetical protein
MSTSGFVDQVGAVTAKWHLSIGACEAWCGEKNAATLVFSALMTVQADACCVACRIEARRKVDADAYHYYRRPLAYCGATAAVKASKVLWAVNCHRCLDAIQERLTQDTTIW